MAKFRIQSHGRLQEWVAEEKGYFKEEGLDYEFLVKPIATWSSQRRVHRIGSGGGAARRLRVHRGWSGMRS